MTNREKLQDMTVVCFPKKLVVDGRPELSVFPLQVAFMAVAERDGQVTARASSYVPELATYALDGSKRSLYYDNVLGGDSALRITFETIGGTYVGEKVLAGHCVAQATGRDWNEFFVQLSGVGVVDGERCELHRFG